MCVQLRLHKYRSRTKIQEFADKYNNSLPLKPNGKRPLAKMIRQQHTHLIEHLVELFHLELKKKAALGHLQAPGEDFPSFRTNCVQLAKRMNCSERTARNLRHRLKEAGVIAAEKWHGSNSSVEIWLNPALIHLTLPAEGPQNVATAYRRPTMVSDVATQAPQVLFLDPDLQSLPHTVTSKTFQGTNELNKLSGAHNSTSPDNQSVTEKEGLKSVDNDVKKPQNDVEKAQTGSDQGTTRTGTGYTTSRTPDRNTPPELRAAPPAVSPDAFDEVAAGLTTAQYGKLLNLTERIYRVLIRTLYADRWIAEQERDRTLARIAEYLRYGKPHRWTGGANEIVTRIGLVARYIRDHYRDGFNMPLPSAYVDIRNNRKVAFVRTKAWYQEHKRKVWEIKNQELLTKAINEYQRSQEQGSTSSPAETYRRIAQRLGKRDQALLSNFHKAISDAA